MYGDCQVMQQSSSSMMMGASVNGVGSNMNMSMPMDVNMNMSIPLDPIFTMENPNQLTTFMTNLPPFHSFSSSIIPKEEKVGAMRKEEELDKSVSGSGQMDVVSCEEERDTTEHEHEQNQNQQEPQLLDANGKKKRYHRHTVRQIQEMEALFKECPHPDDKQRMRLSQDLGLKPRQVKFWFQNRRTQMKAQQDRADNVILRVENESLKSENFRLQAAMGNLACPNCGGPAILGEMSFDEQNLRVENARLKEELDRLSCIASRYTGRPITTQLGPAPPLLLPSLDLDMGIYSRNFNQPNPNQFNDSIREPKYFTNTDTTFVREEDKHMVIDMSISAIEQLVRMCRTNDPLWVNKEGTCGGEVMNLQEHGKMFPSWGVNLEKKDMRLEATRDRGHVMMNGVTLVDAFLDVNKWADLFPSIVSNAKTLQVITPNLADNDNGSLHLMYAEFQVLSPLVPTREAYFFRYCQHNVEEGFWVIVDFDADGLIQEGFQINANRGYKRRPSGFIFQDMPNGYSMVTWVEQAEVESKPVHQIFDHFVTSGGAFGATRWLAVLQHQCNRLASLMARNVSDLGVIPSAEARKNMMRLSLRMIKTFCSNFCSSVSMIQPWTALSYSSNDTIRITTRKNSEAGQPNGVILSAVSTTWLPFSHLQVFELLTDENRRSQLDVLSGGNSLHEVAHIANGSHHKNCVSLFRINASSNSSQNVELLLQESSTHPSGGSLVVYTTMDVDSVQVAMSGEDPSYIPLLPNGFVVVPSSSLTATGNTSTNGCLLTVGLQVLASAIPSAKLNLSSVTAINNHLSNVVDQIRTALEHADVSVANTVLLEN